MTRLSSISRYWLLPAAGLSFAFAVGCGAGDSGNGDGTGGTGTGSSTSSSGGSSNGGLDIGGSTGGSGSSSDGRDVTTREPVCDANGENCVCLRLAVLGTFDSSASGGDKDVSAFTTWLNGKSGGTATASIISTKPAEINAAWLANYDILILINLNSWTFTTTEKMAVETWVKESGGGIVALTGFDSTQNEAAASSQLIEFSGIKYDGSLAASTQVANGSSSSGTPVTYQGGTTNLKQCLNWNDGRYTAKNTSAIPFIPQTDANLSKLTDNLNYVGAYYGAAVVAPTGATVVAKDPVSGANAAVAMTVDNAGRIFAFGDEWVIYANQWAQTGTPPNGSTDASNICYVPANGTTAAFFHSTASLYQTKQFWYNAINWVAPPTQCGFKIVDDGVIIK